MPPAAAPSSGKSGTAPGKTTGRQARYLAQSVILEETGPSTLVRVFLMTVCAMVAAFGLWAGLSSVKEVAVANGAVVPSSSVKDIQHKEGGIVQALLVSKGQLVEEGQVLVELDPVAQQSELSRLESRRAALRLKAERLRAFGNGEEPDFSAVEEAFPALATDQQAIWQLQMEEHEASRLVLINQFERNQRQAALLTSQKDSLEKQAGLLGEQRAMRQELVNLGLSSRLTFLEVELELEQLTGEITRLTRELDVTLEERSEIRSRLQQLEATTRRTALDEVGEVNAELAEVTQLLAAERDRLNRLEVRAPVRGLVLDLAVTTRGAVLQPGDSLVTLVPVEDALVVEARLQTRDIGHVAVGQTVTVKVSSYDFARYGSVQGTLTDISPTTFVDEESGDPYYKGLVALERNYVGDREGEHPILPGMTVVADIITGEKTVLAYLLKPIYISLNQAFRER